MYRVSIFLLSILFDQTVLLGTIEAQKSKLQKGIYANENSQYTLLNINNLTSWVRSDGLLNHTPNKDVGTRFPRGTATVIYQDGFVWGGKAYINSEMTQPAPFEQTIRVGGANYRTSTRAGRILGFGETAFASNSNTLESRSYRIRRDYFFMTSEEKLIDAAELNEIEMDDVTPLQMEEIQQQYARDWQEWPVQFGAPFIDRNSNGVYDPPPNFSQSFTHADLISGKYDEPGIAAGNYNFPADQVIWTVFNDLDSDSSRKFADSEPLGLEFQLTQWAFKSKDDWNGIYYRKLKMINKGGVEISEDGSKGSFWIDSMYICLWVDGDLGTWRDDLVGCDTSLNLGYYYNHTSRDLEFLNFNLPPPSFGYTILQGPRIPEIHKTGYFDGRIILGWENLPMTAFIYHASGDPFSEPRGPYEIATITWYKVLRGFAPIQGPPLYFPFPDGLKPGPFPLSGNPILGTGFIDGSGKYLPYSHGERRLQIHSGPFAMAPGDTQEVVFAFTAGMGADRLSSISVMKHVARQLQLWYPYHPKFEIVPEDPPAKVDPPFDYQLAQNFPNPFQNQTTIQYTLPQPAFLEIKIYDLLGKEVAVLESGYKEIGIFQVSWDGRDKNGKQVPSGIYIYQLEANHIELTQKLFLVR